LRVLQAADELPTNEEAKKYRVAEPVGTLKKLSPETTPDGVRPSSFA
jgi:hypothetical protein